MEEVKFYVRCYDKIELARMYFPNLSNPVSYVIWGNRTDTFSCMNMRM